MATTAAATTTRTQETNENFNLKACLNDLTKIPQKEFEAQFRNWMEKDGVARAMQAKLRADLVANFNKTNLGKHIIGQTPTNRLTLSPMEMALNTLVAEFLFAQNCHFTLSVYSTEAPFRNTLPDFDSITHFRFKDNEVTDIVKAICGPFNYDWNLKNRILKNYTTNKSTALLFLILKALLDNNAAKAQHKVSVGTNTKQFKPSTSTNQQLLSSDLASPQQTRRESKAEFYNTNFRYLNRYLIILSRKVKNMSEQFEKLQYPGVMGQPRVRVFKSMGRRKYEDLNRSLERVTENLKQMANAKRKSKRIGTIVKAIEALSAQFQKCAENFEHVSKDLKTSRSKVDKSTTSSELKGTIVKMPSATSTAVAASQTDMNLEKSFADWLHEMRYTRNGQKFLDRIERSFLKAMEKQKRELSAENEVKLRHQRELMRIRYKQKVLQEICSHGSQSAHKNELPPLNLPSNETISEQFRQFEIKHFDLLSKIYESETDNRASDSRVMKGTPPRTASTEKAVHFDVKENAPLPSSSEFESTDVKFTSSSDCIEQTPQSRQVLKEKNANDIRQQVKAAIGDIVAEERNVDQIVFDAKLRIRELEHESNQLTENFLGYLDRQREQKLAAREAAQSLWNDYMNEREKMHERYTTNSEESKLMLSNRAEMNTSQTKDLSDLPSKPSDLRETLELFLKEHRKRKESPQRFITDQQMLVQPAKAVNGIRSKESCSESSSSYMELKNPIIEAKETFFEREREFKAKNSKQLLEDSSISRMDFDSFLSFDKSQSRNTLKKMSTTTAAGPFELIYMQTSANKHEKSMPTSGWMATILSESLSGTNTDLSAQAGELGNVEMAATSNVQLAANWQGSFEIPQNGNVNKSRRREIIATAREAIQNQRITAITTNAILAAAATAASTAAPSTPTMPPTIPKALNKNNADGASVAEAQQEHSNNYKIKSDAGYGQKQTLATQQMLLQQQLQLLEKEQSEWRNNNKSSNIKSNDSTDVRASATETSMAVSTAQTSKPSLPKPKVSGSGGAELSRKAVLKQTMARMQQLFSPHQQQQQQLQYQKQQIMLAHLSEGEEEYAAEGGQEPQIAMGKVEKSWLKEKNALESLTNNKNKDTANTHSQKVVDNDSEIVVAGHNKNNFLSKQNALRRAAKDQQEQQQQQQLQFSQQIPTTSSRNIPQQKVTATANRITSTTLHSIDDGNKTVEALVDWQQIACGPSGQQNEAKVNADKVKAMAAKVTNAPVAAAKGNGDNDLLDEYDDDDNFEKDIRAEDAMNLPPPELGEIFERNQSLPEAMNQAEIGELIEHSASDDVQLRTPVAGGASPSLSTSEVSSIDFELSVGGAGSSRHRVSSSSRFNVPAAGANTLGHGSDSGSDFWA